MRNAVGCGSRSVGERVSSVAAGPSPLAELDAASDLGLMRRRTHPSSAEPAPRVFEYRSRFHHDLESLEAEATDMAGLARRSLELSLDALDRGDVSLCEAVVEGDDEVDRRYQQVHAPRPVDATPAIPGYLCSPPARRIVGPRRSGIVQRTRTCASHGSSREGGRGRVVETTSTSRDVRCRVVDVAVQKGRRRATSSRSGYGTATPASSCTPRPAAMTPMMAARWPTPIEFGDGRVGVHGGERGDHRSGRQRRPRVRPQRRTHRDAGREPHDALAVDDHRHLAPCGQLVQPGGQAALGGVVHRRRTQLGGRQRRLDDTDARLVEGVGGGHAPWTRQRRRARRDAPSPTRRRPPLGPVRPGPRPRPAEHRQS